MQTRTTALTLLASNAVMTPACRWHLKKPWPLALAIAMPWGIACFEYCLAVPAHRIGFAAGITGQQLKIMQVVIILTIFAVFAAELLGGPIRWIYLAAMGCLVAPVGFIFLPVK